MTKINGEKIVGVKRAKQNPTKKEKTRGNVVAEG